MAVKGRTDAETRSETIHVTAYARPPKGFARKL